MSIRNSGKNQITAKQENISMIKSLIYKEGPISRARIAEELNLTPPTITNIIGEMMQEGLVEEIHAAADGPRKVGRTPIGIDFVADSRYVIGISLGRDLTHSCICDLRGNIVFQKATPLMPGNYEEMLAILRKRIEELIRKCNSLKRPLIGVGIAVPGIVEAHRGVISKTDEERSSWEKQPLGETLQKEFGIPVRVENNVRARTILMSLFMPKSIADGDSFILCYASWGVAGPMVLQNRSVRGEYGAAGEIGHMVMDAGTGDTLEKYASLKDVLQKCRAAMKEGKAPVLSQLCSDPEELTIEQIHEAQKQGDPAVTEIMGTAMHYLGIALSNLISFANPDLIVLSGPMFAYQENREHAEAVMRAHAYSEDIDHTVVRYVEFDEYGGATAAAASCLDKFFVR